MVFNQVGLARACLYQKIRNKSCFCESFSIFFISIRCSLILYFCQKVHMGFLAETVNKINGLSGKKSK
jgi:hypothetical protein